LEEVLTKSNGQETKVDYAIVYAEVNRIRKFIIEEIVKENTQSTNHMIGGLDELTGRANRKFIETASAQGEKFNSIANVLNQMLIFMEQTAYSYEVLDQTLSLELGLEE